MAAVDDRAELDELKRQPDKHAEDNTRHLDATALLQLGEGFETAASAWWAADFEAKPQIGRDGQQQRDPVSGGVVYTPVVEIEGKEARERFRSARLRWVPA